MSARSRPRVLVLMTAAIMLPVLACGGSGSAPTPGDAGSDAAAETFPAFAPGTPTLRNNGGYVMKAPEITTVTFESDPNADKFESFGDKVGASAYWRSITEEYGIGPATSGAGHHIRLTSAAPVSFGIKAFLLSQLSDLATSKWPAPSVDSVYILYLPTGSCTGYTAYHNTVAVGAIDVPFAVIPTCAVTGLSESDSMTVVASHELAEAATDPQPGTTAAYSGFDAAFLTWALWGPWPGLSPENGDVCQFLSAAFIVGPAELPFSIQRTWSNKSAKAGMDPCAPVPDSPYFNVVALGLENVATSKGAAKGFNVPVGTTKDITLGFFSSGPTAEWTLDVTPGNPVLSTPKEGGITATFIGGSTGKNGSKTILRVTVDAAGIELPGAHVLTVRSTAPGGLVNYYPLVITSN